MASLDLLKRPIIKESFTTEVRLIPSKIFSKLVLTDTHLLFTNRQKTEIYDAIPLADITEATKRLGVALPFFLLCFPMSMTAWNGGIRVKTSHQTAEYFVGIINSSDWIACIKRKAMI